MSANARLALLVVALAGSTLAGCASSGSDTRTIQVDSGRDEFAATFRGYFPRDVTVRPGMTLKFHQTWTGEPHTVTTGTAVQDLVEPEILPLVLADKVHDVGGPDANFTDAQNAAGEAFDKTLPFFFGERGLNQAAAQPCFLETGLPKGEAPCAKKTQPAFTGRESYFSSGFIPYLGSRGNEFAMKIADDAKPGTYFYYCALHGLGMSGQITVTKSGEIPSQTAVNRQAEKEIAAIAKPLAAELTKERAGKGALKGNLAGSGAESLLGIKGQINEFTPRTVHAKVGQPVTWTFIQNHSISFNVPPYVPYYTVTPAGRVVQSDEIFGPAGGWPGRKPPTSGSGPDQGVALPSVHIDAGTFNGRGGLRSSGVDWQTGDTYSVTFTKAGTYPMACLVHPGMFGKVVVA
jgi:plastocyanin